METNYDALIQASADELFAFLAQKEDHQDMMRIRDAFEFAREAHLPQKRKSGEPYIIHPVSVARIVAQELELGADPVIAAFLHDVVEDTPYTIEDIRERFGEEVAFLVGVVTKEKKDKYVQSKQIDNFRQILASMQYDVRALLIKLADRLHNMRTLNSMKADKQMKIAGETDYFYAPLANRLGLYHVKSELENLSFRYRCPREYTLLEKLLKEEFEREELNIRAFTSKIERLLSEKGIVARTEVRYRKPYSIWMKMNTRGCDFAHIDTKYYVRVIYQNQEPWSEKDTSLRIYSILTDAFKERPGSVSNYIDAPKENGYQSFQVKLLNDKGKWEELHISSERMVRNGRLGCAAERTDENIQAWLNKFNELLKEVADQDEGLDFMDDVTSSFYYDDIMVFTPKGRGIILPKEKKNGAIDSDTFEVYFELPELVAPTPQAVPQAPQPSHQEHKVERVAEGAPKSEGRQPTPQPKPTTSVPRTERPIAEGRSTSSRPTPSEGRPQGGRSFATLRPMTQKVSLMGVLEGGIKSSAELEAEAHEEAVRMATNIDPMCAEKITAAQDKIVESLLATRPRLGRAFESMTVEGNTVRTTVASQALCDEIMLEKSELQKLFASMSGVTGLIEIEVEVNERIKVSRPITLEDRLRHLIGRNERLTEMISALGLDAE